jgi:KDO2-lipid IV(A) lauroyltransferase
MKADRSATTLRLKHLPSWLGVGVLWLLHGLPLAWQAAIGNTLGALMAMLPSKRRRIVATNLALCFPEASPRTRQRWLRQTFQASLRATLEHGMLWWSSERRLRRLIRLENPDAALGDGKRPVIWLAPHFVGLDMGGARMAMDHLGTSMYARPRDPVVGRMMLRGRLRFRPPVLFSKHEGIKPILRTLKQGLPFYYLPDQDQGRLNAVFAPFFGIPAATVSALPRIAKLTGAQVVPVVTRQLPGGQGYCVRFYPPWDDFPSADLDADVARMNAFIEAHVREMPTQYLWLHRRFKTRPAGEPSVYG